MKPKRRPEFIRHQTRRQSFAEALLGTLIGYWLSMAVFALVIVPVWDLRVTPTDNVVIVAIFTGLSIARGFFVRRFIQWYEQT